MELNTNMTPEWIAKAVRDNPFRIAENGNIITCPVRLSFAHLLTKSAPQKGDDGQMKEGKFKAVLIIPPTADITILQTAVRETALAKWPKAGQPDGPRLKPSPIKAQSEYAARYDGFWPEGWCVQPIADRKPPVVDQRQAPITDPDKCRSGQWAIVAIRPFVYDMAMSKGVSFGLQSVMIIADDNALGGAGGNPAIDFAGVNISANVNPAAAFGEGPVAQQSPVDIFS